MSDVIADWIAEQKPEQQPQLQALHEVIIAVNPSFNCAIKWRQPCYSLNKLVCYFKPAKSAISFGFDKGASLPDPDNKLEGTGKSKRHLKIPYNAPIDQSLCRQMIEAAIEIDQSL